MNIKIVFILLALLAVSSMAGIGITIAEGSILGLLLCIITLTVIMGLGFTLKRRWKEKL